MSGAAFVDPRSEARPEGLKALSVSGFNLLVRDRLQGDPNFRDVWVEGEISNLNLHSSGHIYFSLKDDQSALRCTFFRGANQRFRHLRLTNGQQLLAQGSISVYAPRGEYQLNVTRVLLAGEGELRLRIEELKRRLQAEGLFAPEKKRELPGLPMTLGVATAPTGAAIQDIIRVARRRFPHLNILLAPCKVQGDGAADSIIAAIQALNRPELGVDLIIAGRGGGSFEDLLAFNDEGVVRAYAASEIPIISAVGHEIDHPLSDLAADAYAATPTAAVEMAIPVYEELAETIEDCTLRLRVALKNRHRTDRERLLRLMRSRVYETPQSILQDRQQTLDLLTRDLRQTLQTVLKDARNRLSDFALLPAYYDRRVQAAGQRFAVAAERLENFSPLATLKRGYAVVRTEQRRAILRARDVRPGDRVEALLAEGRLQLRVESVEDAGLSG